MEKKLLFVCDWNKNRDISWSGTHNSIYRMISKKYDTIDIDISRNNKSLYSMYEKMQLLLRKIFRVKSDLFYNKLLYYEKKISKKYNNCLLFSFAYLYPNNQIDSYVYIDLSVSNIVSLCDNDIIYSGFGNVSKKYINLHLKREENFLKKNNIIFTMGKWIADELKIKYPKYSNQIFSVGAGINLDSSCINDRLKEKNKFLFVGRDFERKNGRLVVDAFIKLHKKNPNYELYIIGSNVNLNVDGIKCFGNLSYSDLSYFFNICDVFVMPSKFEAYGLVFIEALCYGLPVIGNNKYEMQYLIEDNKNGYLLKSDSVDELSILMQKAISNASMINYVNSNRFAYLKEYSWESVFERMNKIILERSGD